MNLLETFHNKNNIMNLSDITERKFVDIIETDEWEVETDTGWSDILSVNKTIPYKVFRLKTETKELLCADTHIVFNNYLEERYVKDLKTNDLIFTKDGIELVELVEELDYYEDMFDLSLSDDNHRFYTNGILSHNSLWLANLAGEYIKRGHNVIYYSFEMSETQVLQRIGSNILNIPMDDYWLRSKDKMLIKSKLEGLALQNMKTPGTLIIKEFPTGAASVLDMESHCTKLEESMKIEFPIIICDYIGIVKNWRNPNSENMYLNGKHISEDFRAWLVRKNKVGWTAYQTNRSGFNSTDIKTTSIGESAGVQHTVDGQLAIIQDEIMRANNEYHLKWLLNRDGGFVNTKKRFDVNYNFMRITEDLNSEIINVQ